jgi:hypothetical protein
MTSGLAPTNTSGDGVAADGAVGQGEARTRLYPDPKLRYAGLDGEAHTMVWLCRSASPAHRRAQTPRTYSSPLGPLDPEEDLRALLKVELDAGSLVTETTINLPAVWHPGARDDARERLPAPISLHRLWRAAKAEARRLLRVLLLRGLGMSAEAGILRARQHRSRSVVCSDAVAPRLA